MAARRVDWSFGPGHGPVSGAINAAGSVCAATMVADLASVQPVWGATAGAVAAAGAVIVSARENAPGAALAYRALCWVGAGAWSTWALATATLERFSGPWSTTSLTALAVGTLGAAYTGQAFQRSEQRKEDARQAEVDAERARLVEEEEARMMASEHDRVAVAWQRELRRQTRREVEVVNVEFWNPNTGFTLDVQLPPDGTTLEDIKPYEKTLAHSMDVPLGCAVEVIDPGVSRRAVHIRVGTVDALSEDHHLPDDCTPDSIENDLSMGIKSDRSEFTVNVRYNNLVLVGQVDSGKSNQLNVFTRQVVRCTDALVWAIDLTGNGRMPRPWVRAWKEGRAVAPAVDWIAPTADEAILMTRAAMAIIEGRTADYEQLMFENGWDKIMVSPEIPEIVIVVDEFGSLPSEVKDNLQQISDTGRGAAVRVASCALEATSRYIPVAMINQARERIGMRVQDEAQLQYLFDRTWKSGRFDMSSMRIRGAGIGSSDGALPDKFKGWRDEPARIDADSITVGPWRPDLDQPSVDRCDALWVDGRDSDGYKVKHQVTAAYTGRWDRTLPVIFPTRQGGAGKGAVGVAKATQAETGRAGATAVVQRNEPAEPVKPLGEAMADLQAGLQRMRDVEPLPDPGPAEADLPPLPAGADFSVVESWLTPGTPATDASGQRKPHPRRRMRQLVWDAGDGGVGPTAVRETLQAEGYETTQQTVNGWMKEDAAAGILRQERNRAPYTRGPEMVDPYEQDQG